MIDDRNICICGHDADGHDSVFGCLTRECVCDAFLLDRDEDRTDLADMLDEIRAGKGEVHD